MFFHRNIIPKYIQRGLSRCFLDMNLAYLVILELKHVETHKFQRPCAKIWKSSLRSENGSKLSIEIYRWFLSISGQLTEGKNFKEHVYLTCIIYIHIYNIGFIIPIDRLYNIMYTHTHIYMCVCVCRVHRISLGVCFFSQTKANREKQREAEKRKQQKALAKVGGRDPMAPGVSGFGGPTGYPPNHPSYG